MPQPPAVNPPTNPLFSASVTWPDPAQPVVAVCQRARWATVAYGVFMLPFTVPELVISNAAALPIAVALALMNAVILGRAFVIGTVRAADGRVVIRTAMRTRRYAAADLDHFEAYPWYIGGRPRTLLAAVTSSGSRQTFENFHCARSGRGSDLVPATAARLNAYLAAYR